MKKLLMILTVGVALTACNNDGAGDSDVKDSVLEQIDSTGDARVDSIKNATDSIENKVESTFEKTDSANKVIADSTKKRKQ